VGPPVPLRALFFAITNGRNTAISILRPYEIWFAQNKFAGGKPEYAGKSVKLDVTVSKHEYSTA
jgi:hypothetical protein